MSMSKKDYAAIARIINRRVMDATAAARAALDTGDADTWRKELCAAREARRIATDLAIHFARENERFDRVQFLVAAGVQA